MPSEKRPKFTLNGVDDMFTTQEMRDDAKLARINEIPIELIDEFPNHPYKVKDDEDMQNLMESIKSYGVLTPATVRKKDDGRYEMLSGHRRMRASKLLGLETIRCEVVEMDRDEATIFMCDSNLQRTTILPSEKAFAYKMRFEALKNQRKADKVEGATVLHPGEKSREILAQEVGESQEQVRKYIRLTELIPELLDIVDEGRIAMRPAVEISYLPVDKQRVLLESIEMEDCTPTHDQAIRMRNLEKDGNLTDSKIAEIMMEVKPNQKEKIVFSAERAKSLFPQGLPVSKREEYIINALKYYNQHLLKVKADRDKER